jgi:predicted ArsR family transcriptional regulator
MSLLDFAAARGKADTSHLAAEHLTLKLTERRKKVLGILKGRMCTAHQISKALRLPITSVRPRLTELVQAGYAADTQKRRSLPWGTSEIIYGITDVGCMALMLETAV